MSCSSSLQPAGSIKGGFKCILSCLREDSDYPLNIYRVFRSERAGRCVVGCG